METSERHKALLKKAIFAIGTGLASQSSFKAKTKSLLSSASQLVWLRGPGFIHQKVAQNMTQKCENGKL